MSRLQPQMSGREPFCRVPPPILLPHILQRKSFLQRHLFSPQYTPPVNKIPQSLTFKLESPMSSIPGEGRDVSGRTSEHQKVTPLGARGQPETSQEVWAQPQNSTMMGVPAPRLPPCCGSRLPGPCWAWLPAPAWKDTLETIRFSSCGRGSVPLSRFLPPPSARGKD